MLHNKFSMKKIKISPVSLLFVTILIGGAYYYFYKSTQSMTTPPKNALQEYEVADTTDTTDVKAGITVPEITPGSKQYKNETFRFGFNYKESSKITECADKTCALVEGATIRVRAVTSDVIPTPVTEDALLAADIYCSEITPSEGIKCTNNLLDQYLSETGVDSFVVFRTRTGIGENATGEDLVYYMPFKQSIKHAGKDYSGVAFYVDQPTRDNIVEMGAAVDTLFTY